MRWITHLEGGPKRVNHAAVAVGHKIYTFGGYCTGENSREYTSMDVHVLNTATFRWTRHPVSDLPYFENDDILPYKRYGHTAVVYKNKIYVWGGRNDRSSCAVLFCFDTVWHCWTAARTTGDIPFARDGHTACVWKHFMYIFGGFEEETDTFAEGVYVLNLENMHWNYIHTSGGDPTVRDFHTAVCLSDKMYIFGGRGTKSREGMYVPGEEIYCDELWYLDLHTHRWHNPRTNGEKPIGRRSHSAFVYNHKMYIFGGYNALQMKHYNDMYEYNPEISEWKLIQPHGNAPCNRRRQACIVVGDRVFLFGGTSPISFFPGAAHIPYNENLDVQLVDHSDMHVLDFKPSLKTLCIVAVWNYRLDVSVLPQSIKSEIKNMFKPNKVTVNRSTTSAG